MVAITKLISYIIPIVVLILFLVFYYNPQGSFEKVKNVVSGIIGQVSIGAKQVPGEKPTIPAEQQQAIDALKKTIEKMHASARAKESGCFANYNPSFILKSTENQKQGFLSLGKTSLQLEQSPEGMSLIIKGGLDGLQEVSRETILDTAPCVISGKDTSGAVIPENFLQKIILRKEVTGIFFLPVMELRILAGGTKISYNRGANIDLEDGGFLYTPDGKNICFFPTRDGVNDCNPSDNPDGLDDECLGEGDYRFSSTTRGGQSIAYLISNGELPWC